MSGRNPRRAGRIALCGVVDLANYGDQLFPLIAAHRLASRGIEVTAVAPTGAHRLGPCADRPDAVTPRDLDWLMTDETPVDGILIGGGNIIYNLRTDYLASDARRGGRFGSGLHTGLWLGAAMAAALRDIPFAFNAPGVPYPFSSKTAAEVLHPVLRAADVIAFRDRASARMAGADVDIVPDTAMDIARMWPRDTLAGALHDFSRYTGWDGAPYAAIHVRDRGPLGGIAATVDRFCREQGLRPVLVVIGADLGDEATARSLAGLMTTRPLIVDAARPLREVAAVIAHARTYIGGSLHGCITATAYGVPGVIVTGQPMAKFGGFLQWMERPEDLVCDWETACRRAAETLAGAVTIPERAWKALDRHWDAVAAMLGHPERRAAQRADMLRALTGRAMARDGLAWLMAPWTRPRTAEAAA